MKDKVLIFGNGQMGNFYLDFFNGKKLEAVIAEGVDITIKDQVDKVFDEFKPTVAINTAAKTSLEWCEENQLEAFNVNVLGANNIALASQDNAVYFMHLSSGCIFESKDEDDKKSEDSKPNPAAFYSWTKVWSENLISYRKSPKFKYLILRPRQPVSAQFNYKNMLVKMLTFTKFVDTPNAGTVIEDLMDWTLELMSQRVTGTIHVSNDGWTTPYEIGKLLKKYILPDLPIEKITKKQLDEMVPNKRVDTVLDNSKLMGLGFEVKPYKERLEEIIKELGENIKKMDPAERKIQLDKTLEQTKQRTTPNDVCMNLLD